MYARHPYLPEVEDDTQLWRYMDLSKLISILMRRALFFPSLGQLTLSSDPFEGAYSPATYAPENLQAVRQSVFEQISGTFEVPSEMPELGNALRDVAQQAIPELFSSPRFYDEGAESARRVYFVNCWNESSYESAALWNVYVRAGEGIAITTTARRLRESLARAPGEQYISRVDYRDYRKDVAPIDIRRMFWKRQSFEYEREVRVCILDHQPTNRYEVVTDAGLYVPCDIDVLVKDIYVSPVSAGYVREVVGSVVARYGLDRQPIMSSLDEKPGSDSVT
jgi:hypothetical protein